MMNDLPQIGTLRTDEKLIEQVYVPAGMFTMGSDPQRDTSMQIHERPAHIVRLTRSFWLDRYPVTNAAYQAFIDAEGYDQESVWTPDGWIWRQENKTHVLPENHKGFNNPDQPRVGVCWYEAMAYAIWRNARLPTEAEWEYAARGPQSPIYPWGDTFDRANLNAEGRMGGTTPVNSFPNGVSWCGAYDMAGNVLEWVADWYAFDYYQKNVQDDPPGPESGLSKVLRGGYWHGGLVRARAAGRANNLPSFRDVNTGFRLASDDSTC